MTEKPMPACTASYVDPEWFWPVGETYLNEVEAKLVCHICPLRQACLDVALTRGEGGGIWGGKTHLERAAIIRHRGIRPVPVSVESREKCHAQKHWRSPTNTHKRPDGRVVCIECDTERHRVRAAELAYVGRS